MRLCAAQGALGMMDSIVHMPPEYIGLVMIGVMLFAIFVGFPISFTLIFLGIVFGAWGFGFNLVSWLQTLQFNNVMLEQTLAAVPLFVFMGILMEQAGLMERLFLGVAWEYFYDAYQSGETSMDTTWAPILWPGRLAMPLGVAFLLIQGVSEALKCVYALHKGRWA